jgi:ComF family protein
LPGPVELGPAPASDRILLCGNCQRRPPPFERSHAAFRYAYPLPALIGGLKFRRRLDLIRLLGMLLTESLQQTAAPLPDLIVPVPLHPRRLRERGYNQALEIARIPSAVLQVPIDSDCCERIIATPPQVGLDSGARLKNLRGAFRATGAVQGCRVAVIDDVVTTGGTVSEVARTLLHAGCAGVEIWTLCRTP